MVNERPTIPAPPSAHALNCCRAATAHLPTQLERRKRRAQARLLAQQTEIEARRDTVPAPALDAVTANPDLHYRAPELMAEGVERERDFDLLQHEGVSGPFENELDWSDL